MSRKKIAALAFGGLLALFGATSATAQGRSMIGNLIGATSDASPADPSVEPSPDPGNVDEGSQNDSQQDENNVDETDSNDSQQDEGNVEQGDENDSDENENEVDEPEKNDSHENENDTHENDTQGDN